MLLKDRVAIVTGGSRGIGKGIADKFSEEGCSVVIIGRSNKGHETEEGFVKSGRDVVFIKCDVSDSSQVDEMVEQVINRFGKIDILVNNAAIAAVPKPIEEISDIEWDTILNVNLKGQFLCCRAVVPHMKEKRFGKIINISSLAAIAPLATEVHYSAAKAGILGLTIDLAFELAPYNICVNSILPGIIDTEALDEVIPPGLDKYAFLNEQIKKMVPQQRLGSPQDIAGVSLFLASDLSGFVTGDRIIAGGGSPLLPPG
ncbi:MAG: SDR family oxidoreductase [Deltaproteobacteria bacterium]|nr:SDR family oxidoreductase [Deltaproteobacteria bacterium]